MWRDEVSRGLIIEKKKEKRKGNSRDTDRRREISSLQNESIPTELLSVRLLLNRTITAAECACPTLPPSPAPLRVFAN